MMETEIDSLPARLAALELENESLQKLREADFEWIASAQLDLICLIDALEKVDPTPKDPRVAEILAHARRTSKWI